MPSDLDQLLERRRLLWPFGIIGLGCVIVGGVVAAATGPLDLEKGSWLSAFLVLVGGVAQWGFGLGQIWLAPETPPKRLITAELATWNGGLGLVVVGTLTSVPILTTLGGVAVLAALVLFLVGVRGASPRHRRILMAFRALLVIELVSVPIGLTLSWLGK